MPLFDTVEFGSIWAGEDGELLAAMLRFYPRASPVDILDATYNTGKIWKGSGIKPTTMDHNPLYQPDYLCDNRNMPTVPDSAFDVVVYDPPHVGDNGRDKSTKGFDTRFGCDVACLKDEDYTLSFLYPPFLQQARRVLRPNGLLLAKITDQVNNHRSRWAHCDFMRMAEEARFTVCDLIVKVRRDPMRSSKWKNAHHARKQHCFWIVCRNGEACER